MRFFHKHIVWFYSIPLILSVILYFISGKLGVIPLVYFSLSFLSLGLLILGYSSIKSIVEIYRRFIYTPRQEKLLNELKREEDPMYYQDLELEKKYKKNLYKKPLIHNSLLLAVALILLILVIKVLWG